MAEIFKNPDLPDYFSAVDFTRPDEVATVPELYESERVTLLTNARIEFDQDFFATVSMPTTRTYKKFKAVQYVASVQRGESIYPTLAEDCFGGDQGKADYFAEQLSSVVSQISEILRKVAPTYQIEKPRLTLRCSPTLNENLHVDVYAEDIETHHFRLFVNLDNAHRTWTTSWRLSDLLERNLKELPLEDIKSLSAGQLIRALNFHVFGGINSIYEETGQPRHTAFFEPGEVWFVDSRKVSHQIFYGRRAISSESVVQPENMINPDRHYLDVAERARKSVLEAASAEA